MAANESDVTLNFPYTAAPATSTNPGRNSLRRDREKEKDRAERERQPNSTSITSSTASSAASSTYNPYPGGKPSAVRRRRNPRESLRLLHISDSATGVELFQRAWRWRSDAKQEAVGSLVETFFQFAREIDTGVVRKVIFEKSGSRTSDSRGPSGGAGGHKPSSSLSGRDAAKLSSRSQRGNTTSQESKDSLQMISSRTDLLIVVGFFDFRYFSPMYSSPIIASTMERAGKTFVDSILSVFTDKFGDLIRSSSLRGQLKAAASSETDEGLSAIQSRFRAFTMDAEGVAEAVFAQANAEVTKLEPEYSSTDVSSTVGSTIDPSHDRDRDSALSNITSTHSASALIGAEEEIEPDRLRTR